MDFMVKYTKAIEKLSEFLGSLSMYIVIITITVGFSNVVLRYVGTAINKKLVNNAIIEAQWYLYSLIFLFGFAYILKNSINVRVDFWFAEQSKERKAKIDLIGHLIALLPFCLLALYIAWGPTLKSWGYINGVLQLDKMEYSSDPNGLPRAPIKTMIIVGFGTLLLQAIAEVFKLIGVLTGNTDKFDIVEIDAPIRVE